jgi:hypothetical protein
LFSPICSRSLFGCGVQFPCTVGKGVQRNKRLPSFCNTCADLD